jgi:hypothetical protein
MAKFFPANGDQVQQQRRADPPWYYNDVASPAGDNALPVFLGDHDRSDLPDKVDV